MDKRIRIIFLSITIILLLLVYFMTKSKDRAIVFHPPLQSPSHSEKDVKKTVLPEEDIVPISSDDIVKHDFTPTPDPFADLAPSTPVLAMLYGRVTDELGEPLPETQISVMSHAAFWTIPVRVQDRLTDAEGYYRFSHLPVESLCVTAKLTGYFLKMEKVDFSENILSIRRDFILKKGGLPLAGIVKNEKAETVEGARLLLSLPESHFFMEEYSQKDGSFRFDGLWNAIVNLSVSSPGYMIWSKPSVQIGTENLEVILKKGGTRLKGYVTMELSEKPVPFAYVKVSGSYSQTDETGYYETVSFPPGSYDIYVVHKFMGSGIDPMQRVEIEENAPEEIRLDLTLQELFDITGRVLDDQDEKPIEGALVWCDKSSMGDWSLPIDCSASHFVRTDSQGMFRLDECSPRSFIKNAIDINVFATGYFRESSRIYRPDWKNPARIEIRLKKGICITGTVYGSDKIPVPRALLMFCDNDEKLRKNNSFTDGDGYYSICFHPFKTGAEIFITAYDPEHGFALDRITLSNETEEMKRDIFLAPGVDVNVRVIDENDLGMKDFTISAKTAYNEVPVFDRVLYTDFDGAALFANLPHLPLEFIAVNYPRNITQVKKLDLRNVIEPQELIFKTDEGEFSIFGFVTNEEGNPLKDVDIRAWGAGKIVTDEKGYYALKLNKPDYMEQEKTTPIFFSLQGYETKREKVKLQEKRIPLDVVMQKQEAFILFGNVKAQDGTVPSEVFLLPMSDKGGAIGNASFFAPSSDGYFEIDLSLYYSKGDGYRIMALHSSLGSGVSAQIMAEKRGRLGPFEITLQWGILKGFVRDADTGDPIHDAVLSQVEGRNEDLWKDKIAFVKTDEKGFYELAPLPFGKSEIYVYHSSYGKKILTSPDLTETKPEAEWNIVLEPKAGIEGRILDSFGNPLSEIFIECNLKGGISSAEGWFAIKGIEAGEFNININISPDKEKCPAMIIYAKKITLSEKEKKIIEFRLPPLTPVHVVLKEKTRFHLTALSPMDIDMLYISCDIPLLERGLSIPLPVGRFLLHCLDIPDREVNFLPGAPNELVIPNE